MKTLMMALGAMLIATLTGCASYSGSGLVPGQSSQSDTRTLMGEPAGKYSAAAGGPYAESWEYPRGPAGRHTYMARFDASGTLVRVDQVLSLASVAKIKIGSDTQAEVRSQLGRPGFVAADRNGGESWDFYGISEYGRMRYVIYSVSFDSHGIATAAGEREDPVEQSKGRSRR